jgi:hypothetical protein
MKFRSKINALIGFWLVFIALDTFCSLLKTVSTGKMKNPFRFFYKTTHFVRSFFLFLLAVLNYLLIAERNKAR